jgi:LacI family transcriptional regulator
MKDIARDLGVSTVTISKAIRNHSDISAKTRERVLRRIKELNYRPNLAARALVTGKSFVIGLIVPDLVHPFFGQLAKTLSRALRQRNYGLLLASSEEDPALECDEIERMLARRVDALIIASTQCEAASFRRIEEQRVPYVLIDRRPAGLAAHFVGVEDERVGDMATQHLIDVGCRRIAHLRGSEISTALGRLEGYRRALARNRTAAPAGYIVPSRSMDDSADVSGYKAMKRLLKLKPYPDGVFCYNDTVAIGAMQAVLEQGLRVPEDIALVGCGNVQHSAFVRVPLTSVDQDSAGMGEEAARLALSMVEAKKAPAKPKMVLLSPTLIVRESTRRAAEPGKASAPGVRPAAEA